MGSRAGRAWRGIAAAGFSVFVASLSHSFALGHAAPILGIVLALTVALPVCVFLAGRRLSWMRLALAVAVSQFVFHGLLQVGVGYVGTVAAGQAPTTLHAHDAMPAMLPALDEHRMTSPGMWIAHGIAAVLTVAAFGAGERALRTLLDLVGWSFVARAAESAPRPVGRRIPVLTSSEAVRGALALLSVAPRRGPPVTA